MGKRTKLREAQRHATEQAMAARLRAHARPNSGPAFIVSYGDFPPAYRERIEPYRTLAVRAPEAWRCRLRCRAPERRFLELVEFTFARYPVADHLKKAWIATADARHELAVALDIAGADDRLDLRRWYIIAASGGSLYKEATHGYLTKLETHHFVSAPAEVSSTLRAFWYAIARAEGEEPVACKVARSKLAVYPVTSAFWREVAWFFVRHSISMLEMNDLVDYIHVARLQDPRFSLKGRSLPALRRRMAEWHRVLQEIESGGRWYGHRLPDAVYGDGNGVWRFRQIKTGEELADEGRRMGHCVASYKEQCVNGLSSIWSLSRECPSGQVENRLTIELSSERAIVQCRGVRNRRAEAEEIAVVKCWALDHGLSWQEWIC
jgi:PcfJ-like protein